MGGHIWCECAIRLPGEQHVCISLMVGVMPGQKKEASALWCIWIMVWKAKCKAWRTWLLRVRGYDNLVMTEDDSIDAGKSVAGLEVLL